MCSYGVSKVSAGIGEQVVGMVNGRSHASATIAGLGASKGGRTMGPETHVNIELVEVGGVFGK